MVNEVISRLWYPQPEPWLPTAGLPGAALSRTRRARAWRVRTPFRSSP